MQEYLYKCWKQLINTGMLTNKYSRWYFSIIDQAKREPRSDGEVHHIIPRSLGGSNCITNLVKLSFREHFLCHLLLTKMTEGEDRTKMAYALKFMTAKSARQNRYICTSRSFEIVKKLFAEARRNTIHREESKAKTSKSMRGNTNKLGKYHSEETNARIKAALQGATKMTSPEGRRKYIRPEDVSNKVQQGWKIGWTKS
jgi:hypothetical protein